jgi:electron transfer flavoprotein alpha subunit
MGMDLSYLEALMGGPAEETGSGAGGVWVAAVDSRGGFDAAVSASEREGQTRSHPYDDGILRLVGKARVVADALGTYVYLLWSGGDEAGAQTAIRAGADTVLLADGLPSLADLTDFFAERKPQVILFPRTRVGRTLGPGLAEKLGGGLCSFAADLAVDPIYQRVVAHQPVLDDAARQAVAIVASPAVIVMDTASLPAAFNEPWRTGKVEPLSVNWTGLQTDSVNWTVVEPERSKPPATLANAAVIVAAGMGLKNAAGFALAEKLAAALGGAVGGDLAALDAGWITEEQLIGLTGRSVAPQALLALGMDGDTSFFMATQDAGALVAVQPDPKAPIVPVADQNVIADPAAFAQALLAALER